MNLFFIEITISLVSSILVIVFWSKGLKTLLNSICEKQEGVTFWLNYSNLMLMITPLLTVTILSNSSVPGVTELEVIKRAISCALFGIFCSIVVIGIYLTNVGRKLGDKEQNAQVAQKNTANDD